MSLNCFSCHKPLTLLKEQKVSRTEECTHCGQDIHCCKMCSHYNSKAYNECNESNAERIVEKTKANFCDYFTLGAGQNSYDQVKTDAMKALENLFKK